MTEVTHTTDFFSQQVDRLLNHADGRTIFFFKGFNLDQTRFLLSHPAHLLVRDDLADADGFHPERLDDLCVNLFDAICAADSPKIGLYEELLVLREVLPKLKEARIVVIENNLLAPWVPSCLPEAAVLALFDFFQAEHDAVDPVLQSLSKLYGDVRMVGERALLLPASPDEESVEIQPFWPADAAESGVVSAEDTWLRIESGSEDDWLFRLQVTGGSAEPAVLLLRSGQPSPRDAALTGAMQLLGVPFAMQPAPKCAPVYESDTYLPLLQRYWGENASFRPLQFYQDPDVSRETETITQGQIVSEIIDQCERAHAGEAFQNIFITAPTGAGKSILFQLPALHLAEQHGLITLVVSPLIALMNDQVSQLRDQRGIDLAVCINSTMTIDERMQAMAAIQNGSKSLLYLAPELLLTTNLQTFLGGRKIGLTVIDEAHTVTSWGRDFRSDYWFLGDFLKKARRDGFCFPVLCLTATAVYEGEDDVVNDTIRELALGKTRIHLGRVKRDNISFDIRRHGRGDGSGTIEAQKFALMLQRVRKYVSRREKVLAYFPFRSQVDQIQAMTEVREHERLRRYHGQLPAQERLAVEKDYKSGRALGLFCTKAFGMGVDVSDIKHVIHFAPTGTLSDYIQEIGRIARDPKILGVAHVDYFDTDLHYVRTLNGISEMRQYQLKEMLKKLCAIQAAKKRRNLLIASETFEYLFPNGDAENRTKAGLMLLAKDLSNKFSFPVLVVRPRAMRSKNYVNVPSEIEDAWLKKYGAFAALQQGTDTRRIASANLNRCSDTLIYSSGNTYLIDMEAAWEACRPELAFGMFKKVFFEELFPASGGKTRTMSHVMPRVRASIRYTGGFDDVCQKVHDVLQGIVKIFTKHRNAEVKQFTLADFEADLAKQFGEKPVSHDKVGLLMDIFAEDTNESAAFSSARSRVRVLRRRKSPGSEETTYFVSTSGYTALESFFKHQLQQCAPNTEEDGLFSRFYPLVANKPLEIAPLLRLLELLGLAHYEIRGGEKAEVFVRINDPAKLQRLAAGKYANGVLQDIHRRHENSQAMLGAFFTHEMTTAERWALIEAYFLGEEDFVRRTLELDPAE